MTETSQEYRGQRRHDRVAAEFAIRISTIEPERDQWTGRPFFRASLETCANVSRGGAFVPTADPLPPGCRLLVEISLPNGREIEAIGRVAWSKRVLAPRDRDSHGGIGVEFLGGAPDQFSALEDFLQKVTTPSS